mgnify:CR=1 FL=1|tara:strand:- start:5597 stop:6610 length:1014 start_codon:yes stop_codon:yes gene_type:complete
MFNFIITGTCSKGCSFCFTEEQARIQHTLGEMDVEYVNKLLDYYKFDPNKMTSTNESDVRILGGEPTQHSNFTGIIDTIIKRGLKINLVSNFLFGEKIQKYIVNNIKHFRWMLPNSAELDEKNRLNLWLKNYIAIYDAYAASWGFEDSPRLFLSLTISRDWKERKHFEYIKWLASKIPNRLNAIRMGLDLTGTYLINNKELGKELTELEKFAHVNNIRITSDCQVPPCLWEGETEEAVRANTSLATFQYGMDLTCGFMPIDAFPDGTSTMCYPLKGAVNHDMFNLPGKDKLNTLVKEYAKDYISYSETFNKPEECLNCSFYLKGCNGICGGCLHGES